MSNSSKYWHRCPINIKASLETNLQHSILREVSEVHDFVMLSIEAYVILWQHVMSNFLNSLWDWTTKESSSSVTPEHLLKLNSLREACQFPIACIPERATEQSSNLIDCSIGKLCRHFDRSALTWTIIENVMNEIIITRKATQRSITLTQKL